MNEYLAVLLSVVAVVEQLKCCRALPVHVYQCVPAHVDKILLPSWRAIKVKNNARSSWTVKRD